MMSIAESNTLIWMGIGVGLVALLLGYGLAMIGQRRREADWQTRQQQVTQELWTLQQHSEQQQQALHQAELIKNQLQQQLSYAQATEARLLSDWQQLKQDYQAVQQQCTQQREQQHQLASMHQVSQAQLETLQTQYTQLQTQHTELQQVHQQLLQQQIHLQTQLDEREASYQREVANFEQQKQQLSEQFKVLSHEILEAKSRHLQETSQQAVSLLMQPFQQSIESFKKEIKEIHHLETTQQGELRQELASLKTLNQRMTDEAHELATALRGQKKLQGNWGELVLENVLDRSGLRLGHDYQREVSVRTEEGQLRPDVVVYLPQNKHLIIDAKVSLNAYTRYVNADDEVARSQALREHIAAVRSRIKALADKAYTQLPGMNSPEMVFMFVPIESAFVEAMKADALLFQEAIEQHVLVATPTTLLTSLNIVRQLWRYEDQNKHTLALAKKAESVFNKLNSFLSSFEKIKSSLDKAQQAYVLAEGQLVQGRGNLVKQVSDFKKLAPVIKAELPTYFVEKAELELTLSEPWVEDAALNHTADDGLEEVLLELSDHADT